MVALICTNPDCKKAFEAERSTAKYCSDKCKKQHQRSLKSIASGDIPPKPKSKRAKKSTTPMADLIDLQPIDQPDIIPEPRVERPSLASYMRSEGVDLSPKDRSQHLIQRGKPKDDKDKKKT